MKIEGQEIDMSKHYLAPVTYVPPHVKDNAGHKDCAQGVIIRVTEDFVMVLYCNSRTTQATDPDDLVWG